MLIGVKGLAYMNSKFWWIGICNSEVSKLTLVFWTIRKRLPFKFLWVKNGLWPFLSCCLRPLRLPLSALLRNIISSLFQKCVKVMFNYYWLKASAELV